LETHIVEDDLPTQGADATVTVPPATAGDRPSLLPEKQFGSTRLIRRIGTGGMGEVWLGRHQLLGRDVAIKFLLTAAMNREDPVFATFIQGAKAAASVEHPALNKVHHADVADGIPYLVLEYLDGSSLAELIARSGPLSVAMVRAIIEPVCDAVAELHHRDLLHRDIKPSNIMLTSEGRVVLTD
jgi:eukaryotic-like serine/threonine-protein kinase